jgi:hypothetical protein
MRTTTKMGREWYLGNQLKWKEKEKKKKKKKDKKGDHTIHLSPFNPFNPFTRIDQWEGNGQEMAMVDPVDLIDPFGILE